MGRLWYSYNGFLGFALCRGEFSWPFYLPLDILNVWIYYFGSGTGFLLRLIVGGRLIS
jgi:hypothetical protein